jgi:hypothetical protein
MTTLYIYNTEDMALVARIEGDDNEACEAVANEQYGDTDSYGWTYSPAFGTVDGVQPGENVVDIDA